MKREHQLPRPIMISCFLAAGLEMYDFLIFGFLSQIIHREYLSFLDKSNALVVSYALFAVGFFFRPLGSIIFGQIGDKCGRKISLIASVSFMGIASLSMSLLPSYESIGIISCYGIVLIRIVQGLSVGGEYSGAIIYAIEHVEKNRVGIVGSIVLSGCVSGVILAFLVTEFLKNEFLPEYSWRLAFLLGSGLSFVGYFIRKNLKESPVFQRSKKIKDAIPLFSSFKSEWTKMLAVVLLAGTSNANFYYAVLFVPNYLNNYSDAQGFSGLLLAVVMFLQIPLVGWVIDKTKRLKMLVTSCAFISLCDLFFLPVLMHSQDQFILLTTTLCYSVALSFVFVLVNISVLEIFPPHCRFSCGATSYSVGAALLGGTAPMICSMIIKSCENSTFYLSSYIFFVSALGVMGSFLLYRLNAYKKPYTKRGAGGVVTNG